MILLKTTRDQLLLPLQFVSGVVEKKHTLPILAHVLLIKKANTLTFQATDIEVQITTESEVIGEEEGAITVNAKKFQDILRSLPETSEIRLELEDKKVLIRAGKSRFTLQSLPADDFPRLALSEETSQKITLTQKTLRQLFAETQFAMAVQDVRYYLNGLLFLIEGKSLKAVSTDGHRLAYSAITLNTEEELPHQEFILPRKTVIELNRLLSDSEETLQIDLSNNQIRFRFGKVDLISKLIDGKFPDYQRVIPPSFKNTVLLNRVTFLQSLMRAAILTNEKFRGVRLLLEEGSLKIIAANSEQEEAQEELDIDYTGKPLDLGFNISYLLDVLNHIATDTFEWCLNEDAASSTLFKLPEQDRFKYVVMPMRI